LSSGKVSNSKQSVLTGSGHKVYAHKSIVCARCQVMAAMFDGHFVEGINTISEVNGLLYTDQLWQELGKG